MGEGSGECIHSNRLFHAKTEGVKHDCGTKIQASL